MPAPSTAVLDTFTGVAFDTLPTHSGSWTQYAGTGAANNIKLGPGGNYAFNDTGAAAADYWNPGTFGADCEAFVTVTGLPTVTTSFAVALDARVTNPGSSGTINRYSFGWNYDSGAADTYVLYRVVAGAATLIGTHNSGGQDIVVGDKLWLSCVGTAIKVYRYDSGGGTWNLLLNVTDSGVSGAGNIGMYMAANSSTGADDFGGGTVSGGTKAAPFQPQSARRRALLLR